MQNDEHLLKNTSKLWPELCQGALERGPSREFWISEVWLCAECLEKVVEKQGQELSVLLEILCLRLSQSEGYFFSTGYFPEVHLQVTGWTYFPTETTFVVWRGSWVNPQTLT